MPDYDRQLIVRFLCGDPSDQLLQLDDEWLGRNTQNVDNIDGNYVHHASETKIRFHWRGGSQRREWAY